MSQSKTKQESGTASKEQPIFPTSTVSDLSAKLKAKTEQNRQEIELIISNSLRNLTDNLRKSAEKELHTISNDIQRQGRQIEKNLSQALLQVENQTQQLTKKRRRWPLVLAILGIICGSAAATITLQAFWVQKDLVAKQAAIRTMNQTLSTAQAWGLQLAETDSGRYLLLPKGWTLETGFNSDGREAAKIKRR